MAIEEMTYNLDSWENHTAKGKEGGVSLLILGPATYGAADGVSKCIYYLGEYLGIASGTVF